MVIWPNNESKGQFYARPKLVFPLYIGIYYHYIIKNVHEVLYRKKPEQNSIHLSEYAIFFFQL